MSVVYIPMCITTYHEQDFFASQLSKHLSLPLLPPGDEIVGESGIEGEGRERVREEEGREADREGGRERDREREREQVMYMLWNTVASQVHKEG